MTRRLRPSSAGASGNAYPRRDIPHLLQLYMAGRLKVDELVTRTYDLEDINQGYQDMRTG